MPPTKFLPGDLVLVDFPHGGYWPAEIIEVFKNSKRVVKCFGEGERGHANPSDMVIFNYESMKAHLSDSSWKKDPARKKALAQITGKFKEQFRQKKDAVKKQKIEGGAKANDTSKQKNEGGADGISKKADENKLSDEDIKEIRVKVEAEYEVKRQRYSAEYENKIADLEAKLGEELSAIAGANKEIEEYKIKFENMTVMTLRVASVEALNESLEQKIKKHTNDLEDLIVKHNDEISKKVDENKLLIGQIRQLQKEKEKLVEEKLALEKECGIHGTSVEESRPGLSPSPDSSRQEPKEVIRKSSMEVNDSFMVEATYKRKRLDTLHEFQNSIELEADEPYSEEEDDNNKRQNLEKDDSSMGTEADQSYSDEDNRKTFEEHESSVEVEESYVGEDKNKSKGLEVEESYGNTICRIM